jgi:predicted dithiol-disulfide oxidoreductase (DUF899 family)
METHKIVLRNEWVAARMEHLKQEKELTRLRDELSTQRRDLPWVRVDKEYVFEGSNGKVGLPELFGDKSQLIVQHFMFGPDWDAGCKSCSFWADNFNGIVVHLQQRDIAFVVRHTLLASKPFRKLWTRRECSSPPSRTATSYRFYTWPDWRALPSLPITTMRRA